MSKILLPLFLLFTATTFSQCATLFITGDAMNAPDSCYRIVLTNNCDTLADERPDLIKGILLDSLPPGNVTLSVFKCGGTTAIFREFITLKYDTWTRVDLITWKDDALTCGISHVGHDETHGDFNLHYGYFNGNWSGSGIATGKSHNTGFTLCKWWAYSKHFGFLAGGGMNFTYARLANGVAFDTLAGALKKTYYSYLAAHAEVKFRYTGGDQQIPDIYSGFFLDIGARYNMPLFFRQVALYDNHRRIVQNGMHTFSDVRLFADIGLGQLMLFAEYRPLGFLDSGYAEIPPWNVGLRFNLQVE